MTLSLRLILSSSLSRVSRRTLGSGLRKTEAWYRTASGSERDKGATYAMKRDRARRKIIGELNLYPAPYLSRFCNLCGPLRGLVIATSLMVFAASASAQIRVTVDRNTGATATKDFKFKNVPTPAREDAAAKANVTLLVGESDPADVSVLTDGLLPTKADEPKSNFYFAPGSGGGRVRMDFGEAIEIKQVNSYSWHTSTGAPQVYLLYASDGAEVGFNAEPNANIDPNSCGWKLITTVDTRKGGDGGQYGISITAPHGILGKYRYLLFSFVATETDDDAGNTFYSEIDVIAKKTP
jgi:hypothetical protein